MLTNGRRITFNPSNRDRWEIEGEGAEDICFYSAINYGDSAIGFPVLLSLKECDKSFIFPKNTHLLAHDFSVAGGKDILFLENSNTEVHNIAAQRASTCATWNIFIYAL